MEEQIKFKLFDDLPLFEKLGERYDEDEERFGHWAYANTLLQILKDNDKPITIGLFGEWGTGKSTIINILQNNLQKENNSNICLVVFNAWRHQGDSFRRQLLITVGEKVYGEKSREFKALSSLAGLSECTAIAKEEDEQYGEKTTWRDIGRQLSKWFRWFFCSGEKDAMLIRIAVGLWILLVIGGALLAAFGKAEVVGFISTAILVPIVIAIFSFIEKGTKHKLIATLNINQPSTEKPRLSYPEQFEMEFVECVKTIEEKQSRLVVVVDDLDRCDKNSVVAALAVIKQFAGKSNCVFIVPCDEKQVLKAVNAQDTEHDYNYESLRKFFDVAVRMDKIPEADLHNYAKYLVEQWKLSPRLAEIAVYSGARDARKVKAFLNSFNTRYWMIKERFDKDTANRNTLLIAKLTALQEGFSEFYKRVCKEPSMLAKLEEALRFGQRMPDVLDQKEVPSVNVKELIGDDETLGRFLRYTSDINLTEIENFIMGKMPELIEGISTGTAIQAALSNGKTSEFTEAVKGLDKVHADNLVEYIRLKIREFEEQNLSVTLRIWVNCVLEIFSNEKIWTSEYLKATKESLADTIVETMQKEDGRLIKETSNLKGIESILQITSVPVDIANAIVQVYLKEPTASDAISYIGLFNRRKNYFENRIGEIDSAIKDALGSEKELLVLEQLLNPKIRNDITDPIPSANVLNTVVQRLDPKDEAYVDNWKRIQVVLLYPARVNMTEFVKKWKEMTKKAQTTMISIEKTNFGLMLETLNEIGQFENKKDAEEICPSVLQIWAHNGKENTREKLLITFALVYPLLEQNNVENVRKSIVDWLNNRPVPEIKNYLEYLAKEEPSSLSEQKRESLKSLAAFLLEWFVEWVKGQVNAYNERVEEIVNLIVEWNRTLNIEVKVGELVESVIKDANDASFEAWHKKSLGSLCDCLSEGAVENLGKMIIERIEDPQTTRARRSLLLDTLVTKMSPKGLEGNETDKMFSLLWHDDKNVRDPVCEKFESLTISKFKKRDFNRNMSVMARKISSSSIEKTTQKANSVSVFLKNSEKLSKEDKKMILSMVPPLIHSINNRDSIAIGLEMVEELGEEEIVSQDIISGLEALLQHSDENLKERANALLKKFEPKEKTEGNKEKTLDKNE